LSAVWVLLALCAASIEPILVKVGYNGAVTPLQLIAIKAVVGGACVLPLTRRFRCVGWRELGTLATLAALLLTTSALTLVALRFTSAITMITVLCTTPALVALVNQHRGRDVLGSRFWLGFAMAFVGVALTVEPAGAATGQGEWFGLLCLFAAVATSSTYRVKLEDVTKRHEPLLVSTWLFLLMGSFMGICVLPWLGPVPHEAWAIGGWIGLAALLANIAFVAALHLVGATRMSMFNMLQRPLVIVAAALILHEPLTLARVLGIALVLGGVPLAKVERKRNV
jgi:drug/metabolite transporter (DMT)-like permease